MKNINLGTLQKVEIREIWEHEATEFTPWLAKQENIDMLGSAIGLDLIVEAEEFNPNLIAMLATDLKILPSFMFIRCPGKSFKYNIAEYEGIRTIMR
jgi:hypothetical protein